MAQSINQQYPTSLEEVLRIEYFMDNARKEESGCCQQVMVTSNRFFACAKNREINKMQFYISNMK